MPELTQEMKDFAIFMELYVEPAMYTIYLLISAVTPAILVLANIVSAIVEAFVGMAGYG